MFCFPQHDHHSSARILHSFRSHRSLRASAAQQHHNQRPSEDTDDSFDSMHLPHFHHHNHRHQRQPSDAPTMSSSATRPSYESSRPSTSGGRSDDSCSSIEWNPLGLHPPLAPAPRLHQQRSLQSFHQHLQHLQQTTAPVSVARPAPTRQPSHGHSRSAPPAVVIYDGFDFGFGEKSAPSTPGSSGPSTPGLMGSRRPSPPGGMDGPDFFIKRGGWKRRGIVFTSGEGSPSEEASCDDVFDLEC